MKKRLFLVGSLLTLLGVLFLFSCGEGFKFYKTFIDGYEVPSRLSLVGAGVSHEGRSSIQLDFSGERIPREGKNPSHRYTELSQKYNDTTFNRKKASRLSDPIWAYSKAFSNVRVIALTDYNSHYPKGTDISEIVILRVVSFYPYVKSGYENSNERERIEKCLLDFTQEDMTLVESGFNPLLHFTEHPTVAEQKIRVEVTLDDGDVLAEETDIVFDLSVPPYQPK